VASMTMMGAMQKYFTYESRTGCGFPSVTLLGKVEDWQAMRQPLDLLLSDTYGKDLTTWASLLVPIFDRFVLTFTSPESQEVKNFWLHVAHASRRMSEQTNRFSGWITAFAYFTVDGKWNPPRDTYGTEVCVLDGKMYPVIKQDSVPSALVEVPVLVTEGLEEYEIAVIAGAVGVAVKKGHEEEEGDKGDTVQPRSGWFMVVDGGKYALPWVERP
jgi:hypothetical protein